MATLPAPTSAFWQAQVGREFSTPGYINPADAAVLVAHYLHGIKNGKEPGWTTAQQLIALQDSAPPDPD